MKMAGMSIEIYSLMVRGMQKQHKIGRQEVEELKLFKIERKTKEQDQQEKKWQFLSARNNRINKNCCDQGELFLKEKKKKVN